jgi:hypothetical protein
MDINKLGYKKDSPFKNRKKIKIESNYITMDGVDIPLLLQGDDGSIQVANPNSGDYYFPNAETVTEYKLGKGGLKKSQKDLVKWTKQEWKTKSGKPSSETGERYLPKKAIENLTSEEYQASSDKKRADGGVGNVSKQPKKIADKVRKYRMKEGSKVNEAGNYTKPKLRENLFEKIKGSNTMGTPAGKWSARKAQLLAKEYKAAGGGYKAQGGRLIKSDQEGFYYGTNAKDNPFLFTDDELLLDTFEEENCVGENCLGNTTKYYNNYVAPNLGLQSSWQWKKDAPSGENNPRSNDYGTAVDSWDIHSILEQGKGKSMFRATKKDVQDLRKLQETVGTIPVEQTPFGKTFKTKEERQNLYKSLPIGTVIGFGNSEDLSAKDISDSYDVKSGSSEIGSRHSAIVVGYTSDGEPIIYDYKENKKLSESMFGIDDITNITVPKDAADKNYNFNSSQKRYTPVKITYTGDTEYDTKEFSPFIDSLRINKNEIANTLNLTDEQYNEYVKVAGAIALGETRGGDDSIVRWKGLIPIPSYATDKLGFGKTKGVTQVNPDNIWNNPNLKRKAEQLGLTPKSSLFDPEVAAKMSMIMIQENDRLSKSYAEKNNLDLSLVERQAYMWANPSALRKGKINRNSPGVKKIKEEYDNIYAEDINKLKSVPVTREEGEMVYNMDLPEVLIQGKRFTLPKEKVSVTRQPLKEVKETKPSVKESSIPRTIERDGNTYIWDEKKEVYYRIWDPKELDKKKKGGIIVTPYGYFINE